MEQQVGAKVRPGTAFLLPRAAVRARVCVRGLFLARDRLHLVISGNPLSLPLSLSSGRADEEEGSATFFWASFMAAEGVLQKRGQSHGALARPREVTVAVSLWNSGDGEGRRSISSSSFCSFCSPFFVFSLDFCAYATDFNPWKREISLPVFFLLRFTVKLRADAERRRRFVPVSCMHSSSCRLTGRPKIEAAQSSERTKPFRILTCGAALLRRRRYIFLLHPACIFSSPQICPRRKYR